MSLMKIWLSATSSVADESPNAVYEYDYDSYPEELNLFKQFNIEEAVNIDHFNFNTDDLIICLDT